MKKPSILLVSHNYKPYSGGVVSSLDATLQGLQEQGQRAHLVTLSYENDKKALLNEDSSIIRLYCPLKLSYQNRPLALPFRPYKQLKEIISCFKPDIIHVHHPFLLGSCALSIAKIYNIPVVFTHHTLYEAYTHYIPLPQSLTNWYVQGQTYLFAQSVQHIIAPSHSIKQRLEYRGITTPIAVIPSPLLSLFIHQKKPHKDNLKTKMRLMYVGRFEKEKNLYALLDMFAGLSDRKNYQLILIGFGQEESALRSYAHTFLKLHECEVIFIIKPTKEDLKNWYARAHLFVFTSQSETQGLVLAEAMAAGTPVIALQGPGIDDCVVNGINGYAVADIQQMRMVIEDIRKNNEQYHVLSHGAFVTAQNYTQQVLIERLCKVYEKLY